MKRIVITVMDSVGVGALPDADKYHSLGANTLGHISEHNDLRLPTMERLGIGNILPLRTILPADEPLAAYGKMASIAAGMDTTSGHWEIAGLPLREPLPTYPNGFPPAVIDAFSAAIGHGVLGNCVASGTEIIRHLGEEHLATGKPIVYTSADSVFQIAAHEELYPPPELYEFCRKARAILQGEHGVGRVIARPFVGRIAADFRRTENRRDFSLRPPAGGLLEQVRAAGLPVTSIGKIADIFAGCDIDQALPGHSNAESMRSLYQALQSPAGGLIFANFVDFDALYGHRNDVAGYAKALQEFDAGLAQALTLLRAEDIFLLTADHGNDPLSPGTDHNREYVPLLAYGQRVRPVSLGVRASFADLGQTAAAYLGVKPLAAGESFLAEIMTPE